MADPSIVAQWRSTITYQPITTSRNGDGSPQYGSTATTLVKIDKATSLIGNSSGGIDRVSTTIFFTSVAFKKGDRVWLPNETVASSACHIVSGVEELYDEFGAVDHYEVSIS